MTEPASPSRRRLLRGAAAATALAATGGALVVSGNRLDVHRVPTPDAPPSDRSREPLRVALLTDVHAPHDWFAIRSGFTDFTAHPLPSYALVNARVSYDIPNTRLRATIFGNNLLNKRPEETIVGGVNRIVGREFFAQMEMRF